VRTFNFGAITLMGLMNVLIAGTRAIRFGGLVGWMSFATIFMSVSIIIFASARLQNGFSRISEHIDEKTSRLLHASLDSLGLMANLGILSAFGFR